MLNSSQFTLTTFRNNFAGVDCEKSCSKISITTHNKILDPSKLKAFAVDKSTDSLAGFQMTMLSHSQMANFRLPN